MTVAYYIADTDPARGIYITTVLDEGDVRAESLSVISEGRGEGWPDGLTLGHIIAQVMTADPEAEVSTRRPLTLDRTTFVVDLSEEVVAYTSDTGDEKNRDLWLTSTPFGLAEGI